MTQISGRWRQWSILQDASSSSVSSKIIITLELIKCCLSMNTERFSIWRHSQKITLQSCLSTFFSSADVLMLLSVQLIWRLTNLSNSLFAYLVEEHCFYLSLQALSLLSLSGRIHQVIAFAGLLLGCRESASLRLMVCLAGQIMMPPKRVPQKNLRCTAFQDQMTSKKDG